MSTYVQDICGQHLRYDFIELARVFSSGDDLAVKRVMEKIHKRRAFIEAGEARRKAASRQKRGFV